MRDQRNRQKKGVDFFREWTQITRIVIWGLKAPVFKKEFFFYLCRMHIMALTAVHKSTRVHNQV